MRRESPCGACGVHKDKRGGGEVCPTAPPRPGSARTSRREAGGGGRGGRGRRGGGGGRGLGEGRGAPVWRNRQNGAYRATVQVVAGCVVDTWFASKWCWR